MSKSASYPKAGLIFRSNSFRSQTSPERRTSGSGPSGNTEGSPLNRSESLRNSPGRNIFQQSRQIERQDSELLDGSTQPGSRRESNVVTSTVTTTSSRSFLQDRTPVRGMQDIIGRMSASPSVTGKGPRSPPPSYIPSPRHPPLPSCSSGLSYLKIDGLGGKFVVYKYESGKKAGHKHRRRLICLLERDRWRRGD